MDPLTVIDEFAVRLRDLTQREKADLWIAKYAVPEGEKRPRDWQMEEKLWFEVGGCKRTMTVSFDLTSERQRIPLREAIERFGAAKKTVHRWHGLRGKRKGLPDLELVVSSRGWKDSTVDQAAILQWIAASKQRTCRGRPRQI